MNNKNLMHKANIFNIALTDPYRDEENRELNNCEKLQLGDDIIEDFTAILIAFYAIHEKITGQSIDLIDFTHILNKLAVQFVMDSDSEGKENGEACKDYNSAD